VEGFSQAKKRARRGRPPQSEEPPSEVRSRLAGEGKPLERAEDEQGGTVVATTGGPQGCSDTAILQAYHPQNTTGEPGFRWLKTPAASSPVWREKPERIAALAMRTVVGVRVYAGIQRQVRWALRAQEQPLPGKKGPTATPPAAGGVALFVHGTMVHFQGGQTEMRHVYGLQDHHGMVCDALGLDRSWYEASTTHQNSPASATPP
jgi:hypothetical protein